MLAFTAVRRQYYSNSDDIFILFVPYQNAACINYWEFLFCIWKMLSKRQAPIKISCTSYTVVRFWVSALPDAVDAFSQRSTQNAGLNCIAAILSSPEFISSSKTKKSFDTYTNALQCNPYKLTMHLPKTERKAFIHENESLFTVSVAIISDLDLRDLQKSNSNVVSKYSVLYTQLQW